jgi:hypothetical protein
MGAGRMIPLLATVARGGAGQGSYSEEVADDSPLHWWRLNETTGSTAANSGSAADNGVFNNVTLDSGDLGSGGNSVVFDGTATSYVYLDSLGTDGIANITIEAIVKLGDLANHQIIYKEGGSSNGFAVGIYNSNFRGAFVSNNSFVAVDAPTSGYQVNDVVHVVAVFDTTNSILALYLNGALANEIGSSIGGHNGACEAYIGTSRCSGGSSITQSPLNASSASVGFTGAISEVAVYNYALSSTRIAFHASTLN